MSRKKVIVKRLNSIQNLGAMDVLCTDKTGTLTMDRIILEKHCDVVANENDEVLLVAYLNSHFQTGLKNLLDRAILQHTEVHPRTCVSTEYAKVDEIPFDFSRRMMSVVVEDAGRRRIGSFARAPRRRSYGGARSFELDGEIYPMDHVILADLKEEFDQLERRRLPRPRAWRTGTWSPKPAYSKDDETRPDPRGYVAFLDPPKDTAGPAIAALQRARRRRSRCSPATTNS